MEPVSDGPTTSSSVDVVRVPPAHEAVAIEFPGYIRSVDRALAALGGLKEAVAAIDARSSVLKLWLRPDDPLCHPLFGERRRTRSLLLRVSQPRGSGSGDGDSSDVQVAAAAVVRTVYRFTGLADYQYLPIDPRAATRSFSTLGEKNRPENAEVYKKPQPFLLVPPLFSRSDVPLEFAFRDDAAEAAAADATAGEKEGGVRTISFYNPEVPQPLSSPEAEAAAEEATMARAREAAAAVEAAAAEAATAAQSAAAAAAAAAAEVAAAAGAAAMAAREAEATGAEGAAQEEGAAGEGDAATAATAAAAAAAAAAATAAQAKKAAADAQAAAAAAARRHEAAQVAARSTAAAAARAAARRGLFGALRARLMQRAVWPAEWLAKALEEGGEGEVDGGLFQEGLVALSYRFKTGPWKQQYVRCGYDPRLDRDARRYQSVSYRCPNEWHQKVKQARSSGIKLVQPTVEEIHRFQAMPLHRTTQLVLEDVDDEATRQLLRAGPWPERATEAYGWCSHSGLQQLTHTVAIRFTELLESGHEPRVVEQQQREHEQQQAGVAAAAAGGRKQEEGPVDMEVDRGGVAGATVAVAAATARRRVWRGGEGEGYPIRSEQEAAADAAALLPETIMNGLVRDMEGAPGEVQQWLSQQRRQQEEALREGEERGEMGRRGGGGADEGGSETEGSQTETEGSESAGFTSEGGSDVDGF